ncbi:MAG: RICIN domain-containing protein [Pseudomonadota bacterium]
MSAINQFRRCSTLPMIIAVVFSVAVPKEAMAEPPVLQTNGPIIYLADNLDEKDGLGWCIDTLGRGQSEQLQTHSCKPQSGSSNRNADIKFSFDKSSGEIRSATYQNQCMTVLDAGSEVQFGLLDCNGTVRQQFVYVEDTGFISPIDQRGTCVVAGSSSRSAGPYMSRGLILGACDEVDSSLSSWRILGD